MEECEKILHIQQNLIRLGAVMNDSIKNLLADKMEELNQQRAILLEDADSSEKMANAHELAEELDFLQFAYLYIFGVAAQVIAG